MKVRPGELFCAGAIAALLAAQLHLEPWVILIGALALGWALNEEHRRRG